MTDPAEQTGSAAVAQPTPAHAGSAPDTGQLLVFDLAADMARFRRPDTTTSQATYPFITRTALRGLLGAVLGLDAWDDFADLAAIELRAPVRTSFQTMSMLSGDFLGDNKSQKQGTMTRPTSVEWVISPSYRIYYAGSRQDELTAMISESRSVYHTYLGVAEALCLPRFVGTYSAEEIPAAAQEPVTVSSVLPMHTIRSVVQGEGSAVLRSGALSHSVAHEPQEASKKGRRPDSGAPGEGRPRTASTAPRRFSGAIELVYERSAREITVHRAPEPADGYSPPAKFVRLADGKALCLW